MVTCGALAPTAPPFSGLVIGSRPYWHVSVSHYFNASVVENVNCKLLPLFTNNADALVLNRLGCSVVSPWPWSLRPKSLALVLNTWYDFVFDTRRVASDKNSLLH